MDASAVENRVRKAMGDFEGIVSVYLFGSFAAGRQHAESDVDVGLLLDRDRFTGEVERFEQRLLATSALSLIGGPDADVVILNDVPPTLGRAIVFGGKRLFCNDPEKDHAFVRDVQLQAPDLELFLRRMRAIKLTALGER